MVRARWWKISMRRRDSAMLRSFCMPLTSPPEQKCPSAPRTTMARHAGAARQSSKAACMARVRSGDRAVRALGRLRMRRVTSPCGSLSTSSVMGIVPGALEKGLEGRDQRDRLVEHQVVVATGHADPLAGIAEAGVNPPRQVVGHHQALAAVDQVEGYLDGRQQPVRLPLDEEM